MSKRVDIDVFYIVTTIEDSSALERKIGTESALRNRRDCRVCENWQEARRRWREYCVDAYRVEYSGGLLVSLAEKTWY